jgi:orotidine-5'-phosphate decarboxylase
MHFFERLGQRISAVDSVVSVGLDPDPDRLPDCVADADLPRWAFNRRIIDATHEYAACYKPNAAFYEDADGWRALEETIAYAHGKDVPVLLDAKRGDIGNTARQYATALDRADAITLNPYMGGDSLVPFLQREEKGVFVLCRTSNPGGADLQDLELAEGGPLYERVAEIAATSALRTPTNSPRSVRWSRSFPSSCPVWVHRVATPRRPSSTDSPTMSVSSTPLGGSSSPARMPVRERGATRAPTSVQRDRPQGASRNVSTSIGTNADNCRSSADRPYDCVRST